MKKFFPYLAILLSIGFLLPQLSRGEIGNDNPTGPSGEYNGSITTAGSYDPYTGNAKRFVDDLTVTGSVGAYPLKWSRVLNTRGGGTGYLGSGGSWSHSYNWSLWVRPYQYYHYYPDQYEGPGGELTYPDGRTLTFDTPQEPYSYSPDIFEPQDQLVHVGNGNYDLLMRDGGKVQFRHASNDPNNGSDLKATAIVDPYGQMTTLVRDGAGRLSQITEPGGRYLQINYTIFSDFYWPANETRYTNVISSVQVFSAPGQLTETVTYNYTQVFSSFSGSTYYYLTQANYDDGAHAYYTYAATNYGYVDFRVIQSCDDVRFAGPMKKIEYEYMVADGTHEVSWGQIKREKNATTHQVVSEVTYPPYHASGPFTAADFQRTETRGDGPTRSFQYTWDGRAELISYTDFKGQTTHIDFPNMGFGPTYRKSVTDARGNTTSTDMELTANAVMKITHPDPEQSTIEFTYTDVNNPYYLASRTDERGYTTSYTRDGSNRIIRTDYPDLGYETFTYNGLGQILTHRMTSGGTETFTYDTRGLKTSHTDPYGNVTHFNYYQSGPNTDRLLNVVDPRGNATWYEYNGRGEVTKLTHQDGSYSQSTYNTDGTLATATDELGHTTSYTYDEYKRVLTVTNPLSQVTTTSYALDWANPLIHTTNSIKYVVSPMNKNVVFDYDANFRKIDQVVALGTAEVAWTLFEYDAVGNVITTTDPRGYATTFGYDNRNRQTSVTDALNHTTATTCDDAGNKLTVQRQGLTAVRFTLYDAMNRLKTQVDERGVTTTMEYDHAGNLTRSYDGDGNHYDYHYDALNRRTSMNYPDNSAESYHYDPAGNMDAYTNRAGNQQTLVYDNRNRPTSSSWNDSGVTPTVTTVYDPASRVTSVINSNATITRSYFDDNRLHTETVTYPDSVQRTVTYGYDADGNRSSLNYPTGYNFTYDYTQRNQLKDIVFPGYGTLVTYQYDPSGNRTQRSLHNGTYTAYGTADAVNRIPSIVHNFTGGQTARFDYGYDQVNRHTYEQRNGGAADGYGYDDADEVTAFNRDGTLNQGTVTGGSQVANLVYDGSGNRTQSVSNGAAINYGINNLNQYTNLNGNPVTSDIKGNVQSYNGWIYTYDAQNRLTSASNGASPLAFWYDGLNRQIKRTINGVDTYSVWDGWNLLEEHGAGNTTLRCYGDGAATDEMVVAFDGGLYPTVWYAQDGRGNTTHLFGDGNQLLEVYTYNLSGLPKIVDPSGNLLSQSAFANRFLFTGRDYFKEANIYDYRNRFYFVGLNRFLQTDPIGFAGDALNLYRYCGNDPVDRSDPMGLVDESANEGSHSSLTSFDHGDWVKGSDGLSDWDRNHGMPSNQPAGTYQVGLVDKNEAEKKPKESMQLVPGKIDDKDNHYRVEADYQLTSGGKPVAGYDYTVKELTTEKVNEFTGVKGGRVEVQTYKDYAPLTRAGLYRDGIGPLWQPSHNVSGTLVLDQRFLLRYKGQDASEISTKLRHETKIDHGKVTNRLIILTP